jgi:hypothetical protein
VDIRVLASVNTTRSRAAMDRAGWLDIRSVIGYSHDGGDA